MSSHSPRPARWLMIAGLGALLGGFLQPVGAQAAPRPPRNGSLPAVSPDGRWIAFVRDGAGMNAGLYVIGVDGKGERRLADVPDGPPHWYSDGSAIYYSVGKFTDDSSDVRAVPIGGGAPTLIERIPGRGAVLTPDRKNLFASIGKFPNLDLAHIPIGSHQVHNVSQTPGAYFNIALSPTEEVAFSHSTPGTPMQVWVMQHGVPMRALTAFTPSDGSPQWPSWSPDGKSIAVQAGLYRRENGAPPIAHIWLVDVATGKATKLAPHDAPWLDETPDFFPDGKQIAFQSDRTGRMEIWVMKIDGTGARQITH